MRYSMQMDARSINIGTQIDLKKIQIKKQY